VSDVCRAPGRIPVVAANAPPSVRSPRPWRISLLLALAVVVLAAPAATGQDDTVEPSPVALADLPAPEPGSRSVPFSVAGPISRDDDRLTLLVTKRSCGTQYEVEERPPATAHVAESEGSVWFRVDVVAGPDGLPCDHGDLVRVPVALGRPIGDRVIRDAGAPGRLPVVNTFDAEDTGLRYGCGMGTCSVADMLGPGLDVSPHGLTPPIRNAKAVFDSGDYVEWLGDYDVLKRRFACAHAMLTDGQWRMLGGHCTPRAVLFAGVDAASWRLRGQRPDPRDRSVRIRVREEVCNGSPIRPRLQRPVIQVAYRPKEGPIVILMATTRYPTDPPRRTSDGGTFTFVDCPGMPEVPFVVDLPGPIGDRPLLDGAYFPPQQRWAGRR
jgi:hypothetical protein